MKKTVMIAVLVALISLSVSVRVSAEDNGQTTVDNGQMSARVHVVPGKNWTTRMWLAFIPVSKGPQLAVWIETEYGEYVATLMVTARTGDNEWRAAPEEGRPESLPVWNGARSLSPAVDAASSATPKDGIAATRSGLGLKEGERYVLRCEVNHSFDYNEAWPKEAKPGEAGYSGVNGQPSVVYEGRFVAGSDTRVELAPVGMGSVDGSSGDVNAGLDGMTSALSIIESIYVILGGE